MDDPDRALIVAMAAGDKDALEALYARHGLALLNDLLRQIGDRGRAEEALQNVMLAAWQGAGAFRGDSLVRTWLFAIARRQAIKGYQHDLRRGGGNTVPLDDLMAGSLSADSDHEMPDRTVILEAAIGQLPFDQRQALEMVFYRGMTIAEAAALLDIPENTLKSRLYRARNALRVLLSNHEESPRHV